MESDEERLERIDGNGKAPLAAYRAANLTFLREVNRALVLNFVRAHGPTPSNEIAAGTGLSRATVSRVVEMLGSAGLVRKGAQLAASSKGGRRATEVAFCADAGYVIGVDLGKSHLTLLLTDLLGNEQSIAEVDAAESSQFFGVQMGAEACLQAISNILRMFVLRHHLTWNDVLGIGMAVPGPFNITDQRLVDPPQMPGWDNIDLLHLFARLLEYPVEQIVLDNDANLGALGESRLGAGRTIDNFIYLKVGTGIGMGIIVDGKLYRGSCGSAGEFGHTQINGGGRTCSCGQTGCLETIAGADAVVADANRWHERVGAKRFTDIAQVVEMARAGDGACIAAIKRAGDQLGVSLASIANVLNPARVIIDGGLADAGDMLFDPMRRAVEEHTIRLIWQSLGSDGITRGTLRTKAIATGAALSILDRLFSLPTVMPPHSVRKQ